MITFHELIMQLKNIIWYQARHCQSCVKNFMFKFLVGTSNVKYKCIKHELHELFDCLPSILVYQERVRDLVWVEDGTLHSIGIIFDGDLWLFSKLKK